MKVSFKKRNAVALALAMVVTSISMPVKTAEAASEGSVGLGVTYHSQAEIAEFANAHPAPLDYPITYADEPSLSEPYAAGVLSDETVNSALNMLNQVRYIAGVDANVTHNAEQARLASAGSLLNFLNEKLVHEPTRPTQLADSQYNELVADGQKGAGESNIHYSGYSNPSLNSFIINAWCADSDAYNIDRVGHRRWFLDPELKTVGFGATVQDRKEYSAAYIWHTLSRDRDKYVAWPAQEMPVQYFQSDYPWSLSLGYNPAGESVSVSVTRKADGATWNFSNSGSDGYFNIGESGYGSVGAIIFRPENINIQVGDSYEVTVTIGDSTTVQYNVNFFDLNAPGESGNTGGADIGDTGSNDETDTGDTGSNGETDTGDTGSNDTDSNGTDANDADTNNPNTNDADDSESDSDNDGAGANAAFTEQVVNVDWTAVESKITTALKAGEGHTYVTVGTSYTVPASVVKTFAGKSNVLVLQSESGLTFTVSGKDVKSTSSELKVDLSFADVIPVDVSRQVTNGAVLSRAFSMTDKKALPFKVDVHLNLGAENAGKTATLYYYDESSKTMRSAGSFKITATGQAMFAVTRGDEYIVVVSGQASQKTTTGGYTVASGDSLTRVARQTGVSLSDILRMNPQITNPNKIYPNQVIALP